MISPIDPCVEIAEELAGNRAGITNPRGWLMAENKDEEERIRSVALENAQRILSARNSAEENLRRQSEWLQITLDSIGEGVISTDAEGRITFMNRVAENLTGWNQSIAIGRLLTEVLQIIQEHTRKPLENSALQAIRESNSVGRTNHAILISKDGIERPIDDSAAPIKRDGGEIIGCVVVFRDISDRQLLEQQVKKQLADARFLASIVESSDDAIVSKSLDGIIQSWNKGAQRLFGYTADQAIGRSVSLIIPVDRIEEENRAQKRFRAGEHIAHYETVRQRSDGQRIDVSLTVSPILDESGAVVGASRIARDITERKRSEAALRESEEQLSDFFENATVGLHWVGPDGTILRANQTELDLLGYSREEYVGQPIAKFHVDQEIIENILQRLTSGETIENEEAPLRCKDGSIRYVLINSNVLFRDGKFIHSRCFTRDITDRKLAEEGLKESEQRMRLATEATEVGIWEWNIITGLVRWDAQMFRIYGLPPTPDGILKYHDWSHSVLPEDLRRQEEVLHETLRRLGSSSRDFRIRRADNQECRHIQCFETVRTNSLGEPEWVVGTNLDVTERKQADEALRRLAADLSNSDRRKDEFLATLAHELRNPLAPIRTGLQILELANNRGEEAEQTRKMMERQLSQMVRLVDDLMDVSRITTGKVELQKKRLQLTDVLNSAVETSRSLIEQMGHELSVDLPNEPIILDADFTRLAQVFLNLLNNAAKYSEPCGQLRIQAQLHGNEVVVSFQDTGIGIAADQLPRIFDMFSQVERSLEKSQGGLGIGLSLVRRLVELHGGSVEAKSEGVGSGSEFVVRLPVVVQSKVPPLESIETMRADLKPTLRVLVVDDNHDSLTTLSMLLKILGHKVHTASDGEQALSATREFGPEVILLDIGLPKLNGYEVCRRIRQQPGGDKIFIIAQTGWGQAEARQKSHDVGFDHHMVKPLDTKALMVLLTELTNKTSYRQSRAVANVD